MEEGQWKKFPFSGPVMKSALRSRGILTKISGKMAISTKAPAVKSPRRASYQDVLDAPKHLVAEICGGLLHTHPRPALSHAYVHTSLGSELRQRFGNQGGGNGANGWLILFEPELHLENDILVPDLAGWRRERMPKLPDTAHATTAPDWICEILSPSTRALDKGPKRDIYAREGVTHLWLVDPETQTLEVFELREDQWTLLETATGEAEVSPPPFSAAQFKLGDLWWQSTLEPPQPSSVHEPAAALSPVPSQASTI